MAAAHSSGVPARPTGTSEPTVANHSGPIAAVISVAIGPGATTLHVIPRLPSSRATARLRPTRPAFAAPDGVERAGEVDVEHSCPRVVRHTHDESVGGDAGVVHEDFDRAELGLDR